MFVISCLPIVLKDVLLVQAKNTLCVRISLKEHVVPGVNQKINSVDTNIATDKLYRL